MTDAEVQQALQALAQLGAAAGNTRGGIAAVGQSMARLRMEMQRGTGTIQGNSAALNRLMSDFDGLDRATKSSTAGQAMLAEQTKMASQIMQQAAGQMAGAFVKGGVLEAFSFFRNQVVAAAESYTQGVSGTTAALRQQQVGLQSNIDILNRLSTGLGVTAEMLALIPNPAARLGAVSAAAASGVTELLSKGVEGQKKAYDLLGQELSQTTIAYQTQTKAGVTFVDGLTELHRTSSEMRLTTAEMTNVVTRNKDQLIQFGGSLTGGIVRLQNTNKQLNELTDGTQSLREQLYRVGISYEDQSQGIIDYMTLQQQSGQLAGKSSRQLAEESAKYMINLKAISAYTGEDAKSAQARAQAASEQLAVQAKLRQSSDPKAMEKFQTMIKLMPADMQKGMQQMVAFDGTVIDKNLNILFAQSPTRKKAMDEAYADLQSGLYNSEQLQERQQQRMAKYGKALEEEALAAGPSLGAVNAATGGMGEVVTLLQNQVKEGQKGQTDLKDIVGTTTEQFANLKKRGTDPLTESVSLLDTKFREVQMPAYAGGFREGMTKMTTKGGSIVEPTTGVVIAKLPTLLELNEKALTNTLEALQLMTFLKDVPPVFQTMQNTLTTTSENSQNTTRELGVNFSLFSGATDRFGAAVDRFGGRNPGNVIGGNQVGTGSEALAQLQGRSNNLLGDGTGINAAFKNPAGVLENLVPKNQNTGTSTSDTEKTLAGLFDSPNLMTTTLVDLKNVMTTDSQASQELMKQYTEKMDTLIASIEDGNRYSREIANNIA
jgi:hypothetical protein